MRSQAEAEKGGDTDLNAAEFVEAALVGCDDPEALREVFEDHDAQCFFGPDMECVRTEAASLLHPRNYENFTVDVNSAAPSKDAAVDFVELEPRVTKQEKTKTRGIAGRFNLHSALDRARKFRETWEEETGVSAEDALQSSLLKGGLLCGLQFDDLSEFHIFLGSLVFRNNI